MATTWFTADYHLGHERILSLADRPFNNIYVMDETVIANHNSRVAKNDTVYFAGDLCFANHYKYLKRLNGKFILIRGNHDDDFPESLCSEVYDYKEIRISKKNIVIFHYPIISWRGKYRGSWHLHGHSHGTLRKESVLRYDIGVDNNNFYPVAFEELIPIMEKLEEDTIFDL